MSGGIGHSHTHVSEKEEKGGAFFGKLYDFKVTITGHSKILAHLSLVESFLSQNAKI